MLGGYQLIGSASPKKQAKKKSTLLPQLPKKEK
jgi:hypothetical protein